MLDIVSAGVLKAFRVWILGSGPNGQSFYSRLPARGTMRSICPDEIIIACNRAILIPLFPQFWMCEDSTIPGQDWFQKGIKKVKYHHRDLECKKIFSDAIAAKNKCEYNFKHRGIWKRGEDPKYILGQTFGGATVSCRALQISAMSGATQIILVGVDLFGANYFDGATNLTDSKLREEKEWEQVSNFDEIIKWVSKNTGSKIYSATPSALKSPMKFQGALP